MSGSSLDSLFVYRNSLAGFNLGFSVRTRWRWREQRVRETVNVLMPCGKS